MSLLPALVQHHLRRGAVRVGMVAFFAVTIRADDVPPRRRVFRGCSPSSTTTTSGSYLFGFNCFWAYMALLAVLPHLVRRHPRGGHLLHDPVNGGRGPDGKNVSLAIAIFHLGPFILLMSRNVKRNLAWLRWALVDPRGDARGGDVLAHPAQLRGGHGRRGPRGARARAARARPPVPRGRRRRVRGRGALPHGAAPGGGRRRPRLDRPPTSRTPEETISGPMATDKTEVPTGTIIGISVLVLGTLVAVQYSITGYFHLMYGEESSARCSASRAAASLRPARPTPNASRTSAPASSRWPPRSAAASARRRSPRGPPPTSRPSRAGASARAWCPTPPARAGHPRRRRHHAAPAPAPAAPAAGAGARGRYCPGGERSSTNAPAANAPAAHPAAPCPPPPAALHIAAGAARRRTDAMAKTATSLGVTAVALCGARGGPPRAAQVNTQPRELDAVTVNKAPARASPTRASPTTRAGR